LDVLDELIELQNYKNQFLPNALRAFFQAVHAPTSQGDSLNLLLDKFSLRFCRDNPNEHLTPEVVTILCYSLLLLSVDLTSPKIKNKMSKREFVKNICHAIQLQENNIQNQARNLRNQAQNIATTMDREFAGHLYDNVYLLGHVAPQRWDENNV
jgi:F-box protein 8